MHVIKYLLDTSSIESCGEQNWWSQVHHASGSERPDPSTAGNPGEQILTVAVLLIHISAGGCVANGCIYTHGWTQAPGSHAPLSRFRITYLHSLIHALKKNPRPFMVIFCSVLRAYPPPLLCANLTAHLISFFSFTYLLAFLLPFDVFKKQMNAMQKLC